MLMVNARTHNIAIPALHLGFTLIEVMVSLLLLGVLFSTILVAYDRTVDRVVQESLLIRAAGIAQKKMEMLIASGQEPNTVDLNGMDELDPMFSWQIDLRRVTPGSMQAGVTQIENTVIEATVEVTCEKGDFDRIPRVELKRYFASMKPRPGQSIAVPLSREAQEPLWLIELREELGREPTFDEVIQRMFEIEGTPADLIEQMEEPDDEEVSEVGTDIP